MVPEVRSLKWVLQCQGVSKGAFLPDVLGKNLCPYLFQLLETARIAPTSSSVTMYPSLTLLPSSFPDKYSCEYIGSPG